MNNINNNVLLFYEASAAYLSVFLRPKDSPRPTIQLNCSKLTLSHSSEPILIYLICKFS